MMRNISFLKNKKKKVPDYITTNEKEKTNR